MERNPPEQRHHLFTQNDTNTQAGRKKKGSQSNHDEYVVPDCVASWADEPLYMLVSRWCMLQEKWLNRNDISEAFHMPLRRASYQLAYISRKKNRVVCKTRYGMNEENRNPRSEIWVERIIEDPPVNEPVDPEYGRSESLIHPVSNPKKGVGSGMVGNAGLWERMLRGVRCEPGKE